MNINDAAGVKALLDQLRGTQAWKEVTTQPLLQLPPPPDNPPHHQLAPNLPTSSTLTPSASTSVASLLSQLESSPSWAAIGPGNIDVSRSTTPLPNTPVVVAPAVPFQDLRSVTFQQALPHIAQLVNDPRFVAVIKKMKKEQDDLERQLWEDRRDIHRKYEEKLKVAMAKANMIGDSGLSKHEGEMLQTGLKKDLEKFDRERILSAWDGLVSKQQAILADQGVPMMFVTNEASDRERQQRVMQVLEGVV